MKLVIAATPNVAIPTIDLLSKTHEITLVTQPDSPSGRGKKLTPSEVAQRYENVLKPQTESDFAEVLKGSDLLITIGYGRILSEQTLQIPRFGGINLHFSLLPKWRGAAPVQRAIEAGDKVSGVTVFQMDKGMDTGPIWIQKSFDLPYGISSAELFKELSEIGALAVLEALTEIESGGSPIAQAGQSSNAHKVDKRECVIDWTKSNQEILRKIKAFGSNPGVTTSIRNTIYKITDARISESSLQPGQLNLQGEVGTGSGSIQILSLTPAGKRNMSTSEWLNGFKVQAGDRFE